MLLLLLLIVIPNHLYSFNDIRPATRYNFAMPKWVKTIVAVLLLPLCAGAVSALVKVLRATGSADAFWVAFIGGAACWFVIFLLLPKPMLVYVFGHELTHALWTWLFGGSVKRFKATSNGGRRLPCGRRWAM